jgi:hypothetical protein
LLTIYSSVIQGAVRWLRASLGAGTQSLGTRIVTQVLQPTMLDEFERKPEDNISRVHDVRRGFRHHLSTGCTHR